MSHPQALDTVQRPETKAFERCLVQALPPQNRRLFLPPNLYYRKGRLWLQALPGTLLLLLTLLLIHPGRFQTDYHPCDYSIPEIHTLPEPTRLLFQSRRAGAVPDESTHLQQTLAHYRKINTQTATLLRFYLVYDPLLNPDLLVSCTPTAALRARVQDGLMVLEKLPVSRQTRAALFARLSLAQWLFSKTPDDLDCAWNATEAAELIPTTDRLDLQIFILNRLLDETFFGKIYLNGASYARHTVTNLLQRLITLRESIEETHP